MDKLANDWLEESVYVIEQKASVLNMVALLSVGGVIAWGGYGRFRHARPNHQRNGIRQ